MQNIRGPPTVAFRWEAYAYPRPIHVKGDYSPAHARMEPETKKHTLRNWIVGGLAGAAAIAGVAAAGSAPPTPAPITTQVVPVLTQTTVKQYLRDTRIFQPSGLA